MCKLTRASPTTTKGQTVTLSKTSAPRSTVVHLVSSGPVRNYSHETACGRRIGDEWAGEYNEAPTGPVTCKQCAPIAAAEEAAEEVTLADRATFSIGERVGILTGLQSKGGAWVHAYGTVMRHVEYWTGVVEYVIATDNGDEDGCYRGYLLTHADDTGAYASDEIVENVTPIYDEVDRALSMRRHPAGKGRPVEIKGSHVVGGLAVTRSTHRDPLTGGAVFACDVPELDAFPGIAEDDGRTGIIKSGGSLYFRLF